MNSHSRQDAILAGFILLSLLMHFLLVRLLPDRVLFPPAREKEPVVVEVRPPQPRARELDLPQEPDQERPRETPAKRLGPSDRVAPKEVAPRGDAIEDRLPSRPPVVQTPPPKVLPEKGKSGSPRATDPSKVDLSLPQNTLARVQQEMTRKARPDVAEGEGGAVWLDTEKDILGSFFVRFRRNIYNVWNYPPVAAERGEKGTCLLKITINRDGSVGQVEILQTTGSEILDREAFAAVYRGATYGDLPSAYEGENLQFMAYFQYRLSYPDGRGGDIFGAR
ncbi:MAG: TonB family protein [Syntrophotaleaceae bacterium]